MIDRIALILVIIGALNWGTVGLFGFDMVAAAAERLVLANTSAAYDQFLAAAGEDD